MNYTNVHRFHCRVSSAANYNKQGYRVSFMKCKQAPEVEGTAATCSHFTAPVWVSLPLLPAWKMSPLLALLSLVA